MTWYYTIKLRGDRRREPEVVLRALYLPIDSDLLLSHPHKEKTYGPT